MLEVFRSRRMAALGLLGFASGVPLYLTERNLQAWMTIERVDLSVIGLFSLVGLPYTLKFLWSPFIDRYSLASLGRRKGWLIATQAGLVLAIAAMAFLSPQDTLEWIAVTALLISFISATQDITIDAYRADILEAREVGAGAGVLVGGYRIALILTGSVGLILADRMSWPAVYLLAAGVMLCVMALSLLVPEPPAAERPQSIAEAVRLPFLDFFQRAGVSAGLVVLAFIVLYRLGDSMIGSMTTPFLLQTGFTQTDVGAIQGGLGLFATIIGVLAAGAMISRIGIYHSLWVCGILQALSNLAYFVLARAGQHYELMIATIIVENICSGLGTGAIVGFLTHLCNPRFSATQYALLSSIMAVSRQIFVAPAGSLAEFSGWPLFFLLSLAGAVPGLAILPLVSPKLVNMEPCSEHSSTSPVRKRRERNC
jgi:PAT family beta-lactamase induction signal transducer AmpG